MEVIKSIDVFENITYYKMNKENERKKLIGQKITSHEQTEKLKKEWKIQNLLRIQEKGNQTNKKSCCVFFQYSLMLPRNLKEHFRKYCYEIGTSPFTKRYNK